MTFAGAIFLIVAGAILRWGVNLHIKHVNEDVIGLILIIAGIVGSGLRDLAGGCVVAAQRPHRSLRRPRVTSR